MAGSVSKALVVLTPIMERFRTRRDLAAPFLKSSLAKVFDCAVFSYTTIRPVFSGHWLFLIGLRRADRNLWLALPSFL